MEMKDICSICDDVGEHNTMKSINETDSDLICDECINDKRMNFLFGIERKLKTLKNMMNPVDCRKLKKDNNGIEISVDDNIDDSKEVMVVLDDVIEPLIINKTREMKCYINKQVMDRMNVLYKKYKTFNS